MAQTAKLNPAQEELFRAICRSGCYFLAVLALVFLVAYCGIGALISPSDWVEVMVGPFPAETDAFFVVAEDADGIAPLGAYHTKVVPFALPRRFSSVENLDDHLPSTTNKLSLRWVPAGRYGVLMHRRDGIWRIRWPGPRDIRHPSAWRYLFSGGTAAIRFPATDQTAAPPPEVLDRLRLSPSSQRTRDEPKAQGPQDGPAP